MMPKRAIAVWSALVGGSLGLHVQSPIILWSEEFKDTAELDTATWSCDLGNGGWGNGELQTYTKENVDVEPEGEGYLRIKVDYNATSYKFTSGRIKTEDKFSFLYGNLVARIKVPNVVEGLWPAFWTMGWDYKHVDWPTAGEVDVMEMGQGEALRLGVANRRVVSGAHWEHDGRLAAYAQNLTVPQDLHGDFHLYELDWTPHSLATYVDGQRIWSMDIDLTVCTDCHEFHQPHFVLLNVAVGGGFTFAGNASTCAAGGASSSAMLSGPQGSSGGSCLPTKDDITAPMPSYMWVDWIRLYENGFTTVMQGSPSQSPSEVPSVDHPSSMPTTVPSLLDPTAAPIASTEPTQAPTASKATGSPSSRPQPPSLMPTLGGIAHPPTVSPLASTKTTEPPVAAVATSSPMQPPETPAPIVEGMVVPTTTAPTLPHAPPPPPPTRMPYEDWATSSPPMTPTHYHSEAPSCRSSNGKKASKTTSGKKGDVQVGAKGEAAGRNRILESLGKKGTKSDSPSSRYCGAAGKKGSSGKASKNGPYVQVTEQFQITKNDGQESFEAALVDNTQSQFYTEGQSTADAAVASIVLSSRESQGGTTSSAFSQKQQYWLASWLVTLLATAIL